MRKSARAIIIKDNKIYLIKRCKNEKTYWVIPGGGIENTETPIEALLRESVEELGLILNPDKCNLIHTIEEIDNIQYFFKCDEILGKVNPTGDELNSNNPNNTYEIDLITIDNLKTINLVPEEIKEFILKTIR